MSGPHLLLLDSFNLKETLIKSRDDCCMSDWVFYKARVRGNTRSGLAQASNAVKRPSAHSPKGCDDHEVGGSVGFAITARKGMLMQSRLTCDSCLPQQSQRDLIRVSLTAVPYSPAVAHTCAAAITIAR